MRKLFLTALILVLLYSCSANDDVRRNNPNLPNLTLRLQLNLGLPEYNQLRFPGNSYVTYNRGIKGVVVYNVNNSQFSAFELSDPNHPPNSCSAMEVQGITAKCRCDDANEYNIVTGELTKGEGEYPMKAYRTEMRGNILEVYN